MKSRILQFYRQSSTGRVLLSFPVHLYKILISLLFTDEAWCRAMFKWVHGYPLNLDAPKTLNEKFQWLKLYNRKPEFTNWADKYKVRDHIRDRLGVQYLIPMVAVTDDPNKFDFAALPEPFIIKPTHSSGHAIIVREKASMNWSSVTNQCRRWLKTNLYHDGREWQYKGIPPRIIVEKLLEDDDGRLPLDYKFHCIHGKVVAIQVDIDREKDHKRNFYDKEWNMLPFTWSVCVGEKPLWPNGRAIAKPKLLPELIHLTEQLAESFLYIRIDWYIGGTQIYFGEVTFHPGGGYERMIPFSWDKKFGEMLQLTNVQSKKRAA